ncbi:ribonuclease P protein subunit p29 isoform X1 [Gallus gallus]|uniref:ribonuclease P protein subunit p29 isoform X1 n=1 Tax=Gallus gallus TaxID=9031 RepID=UPI001F02E5B6|nr:ribonuclease P protein subunit p29 isoform X1 [Gallus gallus]
MEGVLYGGLPREAAKELRLQPQGSEEAKAFVSAFLKRSMPQKKDEAIQDVLTRKAVVLEHHCRRRKQPKRRKTKTFTAKQRRELRLFEIEPEQQRYELFLPLHELWKQYIRDLCYGLKPDAQPQMVQSKLLKADLHGAIVTVVPKMNNVFSLETDGFISYIYGSKFQFRASERSAKKFKLKGTIDL